jgi:hypothetical protein
MILSDVRADSQSKLTARSYSKPATEISKKKKSKRDEGTTVDTTATESSSSEGSDLESDPDMT